MSIIQPEAILDWLQQEIGYRPLAPYTASNKSSMPSSDAIRRVCRGNMIPVFEFLLKRVKSEKTVVDIRRNILVHGGSGGGGGGGVEGAKSEVRTAGRGGRKREKLKGNDNERENREIALQEREVAEKEVERLRRIGRRKRKELKERMMEVSREEADRKRMLDERSYYRYKQVTLEAYDAQCDVAVRIFNQYHKRICSYNNRVKDAKRLEADSSIENEKGIETSRERDIRKACESLAEQMTEKIQNLFPSYEGSGIHLNPQVEASKLSIDFDGVIPDEVRDVILDCMKCPSQLLFAVTAYTKRLKSLVTKEIEKIDVRADADALRFKYEDNKIMDASPDIGSPMQLQLYGSCNNKIDTTSKGIRYQLFERQKAHVQQFVATEDHLNKAAEARSVCQKLLKRLYGSNVGSSLFSQNMSSLRQLELEVWAMERETAGLKASLTTLTCEVQRLNMMYEERKEAEDTLNKKWKKIEEFDARRLELKSICDALIKANADAAAFWSQQPLAAREHASSTIIPACTFVINIANKTRDLIEKEVSAFSRIPESSIYMLPSTSQALIEAVGSNGFSGPEAIAAAEKNAALLTARAGAGDPSAIPSIRRVSAALQYPAGSEASLASVLESMDFCLKLCGSEAYVLEDLSNAINLVHTRRDLIDSGRSLLNHAYQSQKEYKTSTGYCLDLAAEQEHIITDKWLPELKTGIASAQKSLDECKYVDSLLDEWWEQPASTVVDWVNVDGQNVAAWHNHVKQLLAYYDKESR